jgi:tripartite-type tricarboxylate transporter receptor subunit TctC
VLLANAGIATGASAYVKLNFTALRDFAPVSQVSATPHILVTHPSLPPKSVKELVAFSRTRPGELNFSSTGHEAVKALGAADVRERYAGMGVEPAGSTPEQADAYLKSETGKYAKVVKAIGLRIE